MCPVGRRCSTIIVPACPEIVLRVLSTRRSCSRRPACPQTAIDGYRRPIRWRPHEAVRYVCRVLLQVYPEQPMYWSASSSDTTVGAFLRLLLSTPSHGRAGSDTREGLPSARFEERIRWRQNKSGTKGANAFMVPFAGGALRWENEFKT